MELSDILLAWADPQVFENFANADNTPDDLKAHARRIISLRAGVPSEEVLCGSPPIEDWSREKRSAFLSGYVESLAASTAIGMSHPVQFYLRIMSAPETKIDNPKFSGAISDRVLAALAEHIDSKNRL